MATARYQQTGLDQLSFVMPGLVPGIHVLLALKMKTWMAGTSPAMTMFRKRKAPAARPGLDRSA
jgi:hypothetical protein